MKNTIFFSFVFLILGTCIKGQVDSVFGSPKQVIYDRTYIANTCGTCLVEKFYPIGWSKDGKFAYMLEPPDEGCGCYLAEIYIFSLDKNRIEWHYFYAGDKGFMESALGAKVQHHNIYKNKDQLWKGEYSMIKSKLIENGIIAQDGFKITSLNGRKGGLKVLLKPRYVGESKSKYGYMYIDSIQVVSNKKPRDFLISTSRFTILPPIKVNMAGYLKSPFEQRLALVMSFRSRGIDGPPDLITCNVVGFVLSEN